MRRRDFLKSACCGMPLLHSAVMSATVEAARRHWEEAVQAKGGRAVLAGVTALLKRTESAYRIGFRRAKVYTSQLYAFPDRVWYWNDQSSTVFGAHVDVVNLRTRECYRAWRDETRDSINNLQRGEIWLLTIQATVLLESRWFKPAIIGLSDGADSEADKKTIGIKASFGGYPLRYYFDRRTMLPTIVDIYQSATMAYPGTRLKRIELNDYRHVGGVLLPHDVTEQLADMRFPTDVSYVLNPEYRASILSEPPTFAAGADGWRPSNQVR